MENLLSCMVAWILFEGPSHLDFRKHYGMKRVHDVTWHWAARIVDTFECHCIDDMGNKIFVSDEDKNLFVKGIEEYEKKGYNAKRIWKSISLDLAREWIEQYRDRNGYLDTQGS